MNYIVALQICIIAAAAEGAFAGRDPMGQLKALRQPAWAPPNFVWVLIGIAWYAICFIALARLIAWWPESRLPIALLVLLMLANCAANLLQFRMKRLDLAFFFLLPYWVVLTALLGSLAVRPPRRRAIRRLRNLSGLRGLLVPRIVALEPAAAVVRRGG